MYRILLPIALLAFLTATATAATYSWEDSGGVTHFTDDPTSIPHKYRKGAHKVADDADMPQPAEEKPVPAEKAPEKAAPQEKKEAAAPSKGPARIEGMNYLGSNGDSSYYFDRRVLESGKGATLQYSIGTLEVNEKSGERSSGSLNLWCGTGKADMGKVILPEACVQSLREKFCVERKKE